jgi:hypothetical protein
MKAIFSILFLTFVYTNVKAQCTEAKDADMAKYRRLTETKDPQGCSQCGMLALYFCSARHCVEAEDKRKVRSMIEACKGNIRNMGKPYCCPEYLNKEPEWGKDANKSNGGKSNATVGNNSSSNDSFEEDLDENELSSNTRINDIWSNTTSEFESKLNKAFDLGNKLESSYYSMKEVDENRNELDELSSLKGKFNSIEEIERSFQEKFNKIASAVDKTVESENAAMINNLSTMNLLTGEDELIGQGLGLAAGLLNNISSEERKRDYEERLRKQKEEQIRRFKAMKASQVVEVRKTLLKTFPDGGLPASSKSIDNQVIYIFSYSTNQYMFMRDKPNLSVTNVFPITRNADGMWLFKTTLIKDLRNHFSNEEVPIILGFFTSEKDANSLRDSFLYLASQCDFNLKFSNYSYQNKSKKDDKNNKDFWGN